MVSTLMYYNKNLSIFLYIFLKKKKKQKGVYLWWSLCTLYLHAYLVTVTVADSGLCCCTCATSFERWLTPLCVVSILSNGAVLGETRAKSQVPSVSLCRAPRCVGNGVVAGLKMTSPKASAICVPMSGSKACW